jgi:hypothetical protein
MRLIFFAFFFWAPILLQAQSICNCEKDTVLTNEILSGTKATLKWKEKPCQITTLKNGNLLYYQFNCDSTWLTFENIKTREKKVLFSKGTDDYANSYREGYLLRNEWSNFVLFYWHFSPIPLYVLVNKHTGQKIDKIPSTLIFDSVDDKNRISDFAVYFEKVEKPEFIILHNLKTDKKKKIKFPSSIKQQSVYFEQQCTSRIIDDKNILRLTFQNKVIKINLSE